MCVKECAIVWLNFLEIFTNEYSEFEYAYVTHLLLYLNEPWLIYFLSTHILCHISESNQFRNTQHEWNEIIFHLTLAFLLSAVSYAANFHKSSRNKIYTHKLTQILKYTQMRTNS